MPSCPSFFVIYYDKLFNHLLLSVFGRSVIKLLLPLAWVAQLVERTAFNRAARSSSLLLGEHCTLTVSKFILNDFSWRNIRCRGCIAKQPPLYIWHIAFLFIKRIFVKTTYGVMSEWLRSWTWNPMGSALIGSNPIDIVHSNLDAFLSKFFCDLLWQAI